MSESRSSKVEISPKGSVSGLEPVVRIDSEVTRRVRQHARAHPKTEVCGVLIGENTSDTIEIHASIEALNAAQAGTHVTFTQDAWEEIYRIKDERYPDERIVGWYHSHPGFGVFLSEHDMFIQQNFFSSPGQVAWVYDPHTDEEGCFGWVAGEVHRLSSLSIADRNGDGAERTPKQESLINASETEDELVDIAHTHTMKTSSAWMQMAATLLTHVTALLLGFAFAYFLFPRVLAVIIDPVTGAAIVRDGRAFLPYLDGSIPLPATSQQPPPAGASTSANPPESTAKPQAAPPAKSSTSGSHQ